MPTSGARRRRIAHFHATRTVLPPRSGAARRSRGPADGGPQDTQNGPEGRHYSCRASCGVPVVVLVDEGPPRWSRGSIAPVVAVGGGSSGCGGWTSSARCGRACCSARRRRAGRARGGAVEGQQPVEAYGADGSDRSARPAAGCTAPPPWIASHGGTQATGTATLCSLLSAGDPYHVHLMQVALRTPAEKLAAPQSGEPRIADPATWAPRRTEKQLWRLCAGNVTDATPRIPTPGGSEHSRRRRQPCCSRALPAGFRDAAFTIVTSRDARVTVAMRRMQGGTSWPAPGLT